MGLERPAAAFAAVKTVRWTVFRPWESPLCFRTHPYGCGRKRRIRQVRVMGLVESGPPIGRAKKCPVDTFCSGERPFARQHSFPGADCLYPRRTSLMSIIQNPASSA